ncbi:MAG: hypothetical protein EKK57_07935 [Proteobacteria bacterium]|nr:MAG: hypothetical protein EKK57_07935 [Pseudomonadota bacterium]
MQKIEEQTQLLGELFNNAVNKALEDDNKELAYKLVALHSLVMTSLSVAMLVKTFQLGLRSIMSVDLSNLGDD